MAFHSEWLRNNPKGPHGPIPLGPLGPPWPLPLGPLGPLGSLWVPWGGVGPWGAFGSKGSAPCRSEERASRKLVAERIPPERIYWVGGLREAYRDL